jgi:hypothetical protein
MRAPDQSVQVGPVVVAFKTGKPPVGMYEGRDCIQDFVGFRHAAGSEFAAGHLAFIRADDMDAVSLEHRDVAPRRGVIPHPDVHRRRDQDRFVGGEKRCRSKVRGKTGGELGDQISRRGCDNHQVGGTRQRDMAHFGFSVEVEQILVDFLPVSEETERGVTKRPPARQDRRPAVTQPPDQFEALVSRDSATDDEKNAFAGEAQTLLL